jgi:hypothetical protein
MPSSFSRHDIPSARRLYHQTPKACHHQTIRWAWVAALGALIAGCATPPAPAPKAQAPAEPPVAQPAEPPVAVAPPAPPAFSGKTSQAINEREYRRDGAQHLYDHYRERIFRGKMPPLLYAVAVMRLEIGPQGELRRFEWMRAPDHVPHVKAEIERLVRAAAPFPAPLRLGSVSYTDTWLWDRSGLFQLDTLTEGQLDRLPARSASEPKAAPAAQRTAPSRKVSRSAANPAAAANRAPTRLAQEGSNAVPTATTPATPQ